MTQSMNQNAKQNAKQNVSAANTVDTITSSNPGRQRISLIPYFI